MLNLYARLYYMIVLFSSKSRNSINLEAYRPDCTTASDILLADSWRDRDEIQLYRDYSYHLVTNK